MIDDVLPLLACPHCGAGLSRGDSSLVCPTGHRFDIARQGSVSLLHSRAHTGTGDTAGMVAARDSFLGAGHYAPIAAAVALSVVESLAGPVAVGESRRAAEWDDPVALGEVGAGTGYYLAQALNVLTGSGVPAVGLAVDSSVRAARRAARAHPRIGSVVADAWSPLPIRTGSLDAVLSIFAPRNPAEFARVLRADGVAVVVTPRPDHLAEVVRSLGMLTVGVDKADRLAAALGDSFVQEAVDDLQAPLLLPPGDAADLVLMGPAARHVPVEEVHRRVGQLGDPVVATAAVTVSRWRRR